MIKVHRVIYCFGSDSLLIYNGISLNSNLTHLLWPTRHLIYIWAVPTFLPFLIVVIWIWSINRRRHNVFVRHCDVYALSYSVKRRRRVRVRVLCSLKAIKYYSRVYRRLRRTRPLHPVADTRLVVVSETPYTL